MREVVKHLLVGMNLQVAIIAAVSFLSASHNSGDIFTLGTTSVTYTATDDTGNAATCTFEVTVIDDALPIIVCPDNIATPVDFNECDALVTYNVPIGSDNCSGAITTQTDGSSLSSGNVFPVGITMQEYTVTDIADNTASCSFSITVVDDSAPDLVCPANINAVTDTGLCSSFIEYVVPSADDACAGATTTTNRWKWV